MSLNQQQECTKPPIPEDGEEFVKCTMCSRKMPPDRAFAKDGNHFCCVAIAATHAQSNASVQAHYGKKKGPLGAIIKTIVILAILASIGYAAYHFRDRIKAGADAAKEKVEENKTAQ